MSAEKGGDPIRKVVEMFAQQKAAVEKRSGLHVVTKAKTQAIRRTRKTGGKSVTVAKKVGRVLR